MFSPSPLRRADGAPVLRRDRLSACLGALVAIGLVALEGAVVHGHGLGAPWLVAPVGASAVLVFAVPSSPMAQPWAVIGGDGLSALVGLLVGRLLGHGIVACGVAVGLAIIVMSLARCLHPPGGAAALTGVLGGSAVASAGWLFPLAPVAMNASLLVFCGVAYHGLSRHRYPHRHHHRLASLDPQVVSEADIDAVIADMGETFDIEHDDLRELVAALEARVAARRAPPPVPR